MGIVQPAFSGWFLCGFGCQATVLVLACSDLYSGGDLRKSLVWYRALKFCQCCSFSWLSALHVGLSWPFNFSTQANFGSAELLPTSSLGNSSKPWDGRRVSHFPDCCPVPRSWCLVTGLKPLFCMTIFFFLSCFRWKQPATEVDFLWIRFFL